MPVAPAPSAAQQKAAVASATRVSALLLKKSRGAGAKKRPAATKKPSIAGAATKKRPKMTLRDYFARVD